MALLLRDRDATSEVATGPPGGGPPVVVPDFACETCGAAMLAGQDWCFECGTAAPGRLGASPGWRAAFTVVAVTLLLVVGAVVASYAALTTDAERRASAPSAGDGSPIAAPGPAAVQPPAAGTPIVPGATGPGTTPPAAGTTGPAGAVAPPPIIPIQPPAGPVPGGQVAPPAVAPPPAATTPPPAATPPPPAATPSAQLVKFDKDSASTYDPSKRAGAEFGPARYAVDKSLKTMWDVVVPADGKSIAAGLMLDLGKPYALRAIEIATPTEGFTVELYGAVSSKETPEDIIDKRWEHLTDIKDATDGKIHSLLKKSENKHELLLLYFTKPGEPTDPRVAIENVKVAGTP